ncbi:DUF1697 domain-containing protein [Antarcticibacterium sp. 1MA-6-2]|uniref:DUF1697 domain-containing protein n=1 Tax=Antarcticibacterium sp. 1MA-6-2 TaxID=2908210 RepID=UPI001F263D92|nr:DUF1697 domain-containing protein [Antarcticibacterium sp. 1MA-6-2]UJH91717.1 DUF1697 domain-containing protein [Antarcticibacterium sp. 1MA-6-2]
MKSSQINYTYIAFLRGINVGGHHKIAMAELKKELEGIGMKNVHTLLNSGNVIFYSESVGVEKLEEKITEHLKTTYGFAVPVIITTAEEIRKLYTFAPFQDIAITKDIRLYVSFLKKNRDPLPDLPWTTPDESFSIINQVGKAVFSVLDVSASKTTNAMKFLEDFFGKDITTRNWNTVERILKKI